MPDDKALAIRDEKGKLLPGHGGLPHCGRPKGLAAKVRELADFDKAIEVLCDIAYGKLAPAARVADRLKAIEILCDRGWGKAHQTVDVKSEETTPSIAGKKKLRLDQLLAIRDTIRALQEPSEPVIDAELVDEVNASDEVNAEAAPQ